MRVNIVTKRGWILERCAEELRSIRGVTVNGGQEQRLVMPTADLQAYFPAKDLRKYPTEGRAVGFYTHGENGFDLIDRFDACVAMNRQMAERLAFCGAKRVAVIRPGVDPPKRPPVFGVIGRVYNDGRKGQDLVRQAVEAGFDFRACGFKRGPISATSRRQWPCKLTHFIEERDAFYASIDYLVVTSTEEGGPMTVPEALAHHVPVIAPNVGWAWEFPVIHYERGSWPSLLEVLGGLAAPPTWEDWRGGWAMLFDLLARERAA